jgi:hypothetical protein
MVRIQLATGYLDVKEGTSFPLNFQVGDIRDISQRKGNFSKTIVLVGSKNNNELLNHYYDVNIQAGTFDINAVTTCSVIQDGIPVMEDASLQQLKRCSSQMPMRSMWSMRYWLRKAKQISLQPSITLS